MTDLSPFDLSGKVAIVTGGNGGLGLGMALGLARAGASIAIAARRADKAQAAMEQLAECGGESCFVETDVASRDSCGAMAAAVMERFGRIDALVANAGIAPGGPPHKLRPEAWDRVLDINLSGPLYCAQAVYPHMKAAGGGKIVLIGSMMSLFGSALVAGYAASKAGVLGLGRSLAVAWAPDNIQVNTILPGWLVTDMVAGHKEQDAQFDAAIVARTPAGRWGSPADMAGAAVFLCSPAADFVTGAQIAVDGGYSVMG